MDRLFILLNGFHHLSPELIAFLKGKLRCKTLKKGEVLLREGEICRYIYFVERGVVRTYANTKTGEYTSWVQVEDEIVTSVDSFFLQIASGEIIVAMEKLTVWYISYRELEEACQRWPEFAIVRDKIKDEYYSRKTIWDRWINTTSPLERYCHFIKDQSALLRRITLIVLSTYLQMDYATLKRIRRDLRNGGQSNI